MTERPSKPSPDFPLYAHAEGRWAKKIGGRTRYFGRWDDPDGALAQYHELIAATKKVERPARIGLTVQDACNRFLSAKRQAANRSEISEITFLEYLRTCKRFVEHVGKDSDVSSLTPASFAGYKTYMATVRKWNIVGVGNEITRIRSLFRWLGPAPNGMGLLREAMNFGPDFKRASAKALRRHRRLAGKKLLTAPQILRLLDYSGVQMRAMILLGINAGFGPSDCGNLPLSAMDGDWLRFPRPKTEVDRDVPLWPETIAAVQAVLSRRYSPQPEAELLVFIRPDGSPWIGNHVSKHFRKVYQWSGIKRAGFYWLRHTFETVAGGAKDQIAVNAIMGHVDPSMAAVYREGIEPERLQAVTAHVRRWLFG